MQRPLRCLLVLMLALTALSIIPATTALAATGEQYLLQATDPHGSIWLPGTTDGKTTGPLDNGTNAASASYGHLWTTDVPSGFCRIIPAVPSTLNADGSTTPGTPATLDRNTPGGCITAGGKSGGPDVERLPDGTIKRNADGTIFVYTPDWAVFSNGVYRLTYDPGTQTMTKAELLAPNRYPFNNKPFDAQLGPGDHKLYVANDKDGNIARFSGVSGPISQQTVETSIAKTTDGGRSRAITFVCWSNLTTLNGGRGAARAPGAPGCTTQDPAPDLLIAQKNLMTVVLNAETCQTAPGGCTTQLTNIKVLTPMGLRTDPKDPTVVFISDSPGADSQIIRYHISTDIQDSYANFGILDDGTVARFSFAFDVSFDPQHAMYVGDDPSAGATAFNGHYYRVGPNAPADALGQPGAPANPPAPPSVQTGNLYGSGITLATDGVWLPGSLGGHLWMTDSATGLCRMDLALDAAGNPISGSATENAGTCMLGANAAGLTKPEQSAFDPTHNFLYVSDESTKSVGVVRFVFDPNGTVCKNPDGTFVGAETLCGSTDPTPANRPQLMASGLIGTGLGIDDQRADAVAIDPSTDVLYVGFRLRNLGANTQVARVHNASAADTSGQTVDFIAATTRTAPVFGLGLIKNTDGTKDLYIGDNKGVDVLYNVDTCQPGACTAILLLNVRGPRGFATDGNDLLYLAGPPAPGTGNSTTVVQQYRISTGELFDYSSVGVNPDNTQQQYAFVFSLALDPKGNLYIADNPDAVAPPNGVGHVWKVAAPGTGAGPSQPTITSKPANPTNKTNPSFAFSTIDTTNTFTCSLVATGVADAFSPCTTGQSFGPLTDGNYTFKVKAVDGTGAVSTPAVYPFTVDTVLPIMTITQAPTSPSKVNTPSFTFSSSKPSTTFQCSFTTGADAFSPCGSPQSYAAQPDGAYTFKVQGTDLAGNVSAAASSPLTIDTVAPTVTASPVGGPYATAQSVTLTASEPAAIYYTIDGTAPTTTSTVYAGPISVASTTTLKYIAVDTAGNQSAVASQTYTIGSVSLNSKPVSPSANASPSFSFSAPGVTAPSYQCALTTAAPTAADFTACTSPKSYPGTADNTYTFTVQGVDTGNANASIGSATAQVTIDAAAPTLDSNPPNPSSRATETFTFSKAEATGWTFQCSFVAQGAADAFTACTSPQNYPAPADGLYTFKVKALDAASTATAVQTYNFQVASGLPTTTAPVASLALSTVSPGLSTTAVPVTLTWTGSSSAAAYEVQQSINGGQFIDVPSCSATTPCTGTTVSVSLKPSATNQSTVTSYRYQVRAKNAAGAWGTYAAQATSFSVPAADNTAGFSFNGGASGVNLSGAYNGSVQEMSTTGAFATNSNPLGGTTVAWVSTMGPDRGMASVSVDGGPAQTVDLYSPTVKTAQIVWIANNLGGANGHTIKVTVLAQKNAASTGTKVDIDAYISLK